MSKTIAEINEKIKEGKAVVYTAEEIVDIVKDRGISRAAQDVDVVTTGTFGIMCSSAAYFNLGHTSPRIKIGGGRAYLNDVQAYTGVAAVDFFLGANALPDDDPRNRIHPGEFNYGGGHIIEELVAGKDIRLSVSAYGTDCYPRKRLDSWINIKDLNQATLFNIRNAYQNYNVAVNPSDKIIYTYMGVLKPQLGNANYSSAGQLSPLFNDPYYKTIGIGTKIFLGGGTGFIAWHGTQHNPDVPRNEKGIPTTGAANIATIGDMKQMNSRWLMGTSVQGYGTSLTVGVGVPIPILNEEILGYTTITDDDILAPVIDYSDAFPNNKSDIITHVSYAELRSGKINVNGQEVPTASLSSYPRAVEITQILKEWIESGKFTLTEAVEPLPGIGSGVTQKPFNERPIEY